MILRYLETSNGWTFSLALNIFFRFWPSSGRNGWSELDQTCKLWVHLFFMKAWNLHVFFKQCCCLLDYYLWWEFWQYWTIFEGVRTQKPSKKDHFMDAEWTRKTLETFKLTTTNDVLMKLTMIIYFPESVNWKPLRARKSVFWRNVFEFLDYIKSYHIISCITFCCITDKVLYKFHEKTPKIGLRWLLR